MVRVRRRAGGPQKKARFALGRDAEEGAMRPAAVTAASLRDAEEGAQCAPAALRPPLCVTQKKARKARRRLTGPPLCVTQKKARKARRRRNSESA
jgi:hypothetical protein